MRIRRKRRVGNGAENGGSDMLIASIIGGFIGWLMVGCLVVALITALGLADEIDVSSLTCATCAVILWPVALIALICVLFAKLAMYLGSLW